MMKILKLKLVILLEYQNLKTFLQKAIFQIGLKKVLLLQKLKPFCHGHMLIAILKAKKLLERFTKNNQKEFRVDKVINIKGDKTYVKWKGYDRSFNIWIDKKEII